MTGAARRPRRGELVEVAIERLDAKGDGVGPVLPPEPVPELDPAAGAAPPASPGAPRAPGSGAAAARAPGAAGAPGTAGTAGELARVRGALPGARVRARVLRRRRGELGARLVATLEPGPNAVAPRCAHAASCGGCAFQGLAYEAQLASLGAVLEHTLAPLRAALAGAGLPAPPTAPPTAPIRPAPAAFGYRNRMDFTFATRRFVEPHEPKGAADVGFALGLHARGLYQKVIDVGTCEIAFPGASAVVATVRRLARERGLAPWDVREHTGLLRILVLRRAEAGAARGAVLANLVTSAEEPDAIRPLAAAVCAAHPEIATFVQTISTRAAQVTQGERELVLHGAGFVEEELGGLAFRVSAASFFQTNTRAADALARLVAARASGGADAAVPGSPAHDLRPAPAGSRSAPPAVGDLRCESASPAAEPPVVYDLCCGAGALGLVVAARAPVREMIGFELVSEAVADARWNAARNGIANARFVAGDLALTLPEADLPPPDVCIADPPRAGLHPKVVAELVRLAPPRVVYVSCNPAAAVRDLVPLVGAGYRATAIEPLDLFPHTPHLECVFTLERA